MFITSDCCAAGKNLWVRASGLVLPKLVGETHVPLCTLWQLSPPVAGPVKMKLLQLLAGGTALSARVVPVALQVLDSGLITWWCFHQAWKPRACIQLLVSGVRCSWYHQPCGSNWWPYSGSQSLTFQASFASWSRYPRWLASIVVSNSLPTHLLSFKCVPAWIRAHSTTFSLEKLNADTTSNSKRVFLKTDGRSRPGISSHATPIIPFSYSLVQCS